MSDGLDAADTLMIPPSLAEAVRRLVRTFQPERVYLFGSRARGDAEADSDYDLMVLVRESNDSAYRRARDAYTALLDVAIPMDILVWTRDEFNTQLPADASLPATILREGRVLYAA
jgi:uncharacterized protein